MPEQTQNRRPWVKLWTREYIHGTTRKELDPAERSLWIDFMALAGDSPQIGNVCIAEDIGYTDDQLCRLLNVDNELLTRAIHKMIDAQKIKRNGTGVIEIINFWKYQPHFDRDAYQREYMAQKRKSNTPKSNAIISNNLDKPVSLTPVSPTHKDKEEDIERRKDNSLSDQSTTTVNKDINLSINGDKSHEKMVDYDSLLKSLDNEKINPVSIFVVAIRSWHKNMPKEDFVKIGDRLGDIYMKNYGTANKKLMLKAIWDTASMNLQGSHVDYLKSFKLEQKKLRQKQEPIKPNKELKPLSEL